jgi:RNA polymerase sigma-70 factor (ECF subfamily)
MEQGKSEVTQLNMDEIYREWRGKVLSLIKRYLPSDPELAEELTNEVFIKVFIKQEQFDRSRKFKDWLYEIARNHVRDHRKSIKARPVTVVTEEWFDIPDDRCTPDQEFARIERVARLLEKMNKLTELQKEVIDLFCFHGLGHAEISKEIGISVPAVKGLIFRAKEELCKKRRKIAMRDQLRGVGGGR